MGGQGRRRPHLPLGNEPVSGTRANYCDAQCAKASNPADLEQQSRLLDMAGNVKTWTTTQSQQQADFYEVRGGAWHDTAQALRSSQRQYDHSSWESYGVGVRCTKDL